MRICYFASPASVHTQRWLEYMDAKGFHNEIVTTELKRNNRPERWPIHRMPPDFPGQPPRTVWRLANLTRGHDWVPAGLWLWGAVQVRRLVKRLGPDLVQVHYLDDLSIAALLSGFHPVCATAWGSDLLIEPGRYTYPQKLLFRRALASADLVSCNSDVLRRAAIRFGADPTRIRIRQWGVNLDEFGLDLDTQPLGAKLGIEPDSIVLLSPRALQKPLYCIDGVLRAFRSVLDHYPEAILIQLGTAMNPGDLKKLKQLAGELGIASHVRWFGFTPEQELPLVFSLAKLTLSLSKSDSLPTSLLEAMASGSIPVFSDVGSIHEWIEPDINGVLVPPGDADLLAEGILSVLKKPPEWWQKAREVNREIVRLRASRTRELEAVARDYAQLVDGSLGREGSGSALEDQGVTA